MFIIVVIIFGIFLLLLFLSSDKNSSLSEEYGGMSKNEWAQTLVVKKRGKYIGRNIKVLACRESHWRERPDSYVFSSATVGGITTGGVTKIEGGPVLEVGKKTGRYSLGFGDKWVASIGLSDKDYEIAKADSVLSKHIMPEEHRQQSLKELGRKVDVSGLDFSVKNQLTTRYLTYDHAKYIKNWLSQES